MLQHIDEEEENDPNSEKSTSTTGSQFIKKHILYVTHSSAFIKTPIYLTSFLHRHFVHLVLVMVFKLMSTTVVAV